MSGSFLLLHRALRNAGDALIFERARRLISWVHPDARLDVAEAWRPLRDQVGASALAGYRAIVVCGGPGYAPGLAARYPLGDLAALPPLVLLALGGHVVPGTDRQLAEHRLDEKDRAFLEAVLGRTAALGARDPLTHELLTRAGIDRVRMTGDPAWYDLDRIEAPVGGSRPPGRIALTPPANPVYFGQAARLFGALADRWPSARFSIVHHRGVQRPFARLARRRGWDQTDITGGVAGFAAYDGVDLHLGYRLHAHLYATSIGVPSYVVAEDSRATGALRAMPGLGRPGFDPNASADLLAPLMAIAPRVANAHRPGTDRLAPLFGLVARPPDVRELVGLIEADAAAGYPAHERARATIRATLPTMRRMIEDLP